jgi:hypothetical protein
VKDFEEDLSGNNIQLFRALHFLGIIFLAPNPDIVNKFN